MAQASGVSFSSFADCIYQDGRFWAIGVYGSTYTLLATRASGGSQPRLQIVKDSNGYNVSWPHSGAYHPKMVYMNGYICIFPDAKFYQIASNKLIDGNMDDYFYPVTWTQTNATGDTASTSDAYLCANVKNMDAKLNAGDWIALRFPLGGHTVTNADPAATYHARVSHVTSQYIVFDNSTMNMTASDLVDLRLVRKVPAMDHVCISRNRLWGTVKQTKIAHPFSKVYGNHADGVEYEANPSFNYRAIRFINPSLIEYDPEAATHPTQTPMTFAQMQDFLNQKIYFAADDHQVNDLQGITIRGYGYQNNHAYLLLLIPASDTHSDEWWADAAQDIEDGKYHIEIKWDEQEEHYNHVFASEQGTPYSFECYEGTEMDSFFVDFASDGEWTAIYPYDKTVYAFKENVVHSVYGYTPSRYTTADKDYKGVKSGCDKSVCVHNNRLYWYSVDGLLSFGGSKPVIADRQLADVFGKSGLGVVCISDEDRLFVCTEKGVFVYDSYRGIWTKYSKSVYPFALSVNGGTAFVTTAVDNNSTYCVWNTEDEEVLTNSGWLQQDDREQEPDLDWMAQSARILMYGGESVKTSGYNYMQKYVQELLVKADVPLGSRLSIYISYDDGDFEPIATQNGNGIGMRVIPIIPRRCDHFALRFNGYGDAKVISVTKKISGGSEVVRNV